MTDDRGRCQACGDAGAAVGATVAADDSGSRREAVATSGSYPRSGRWGAVPFMLVVVTLLGSVLVPARQTWRIMHLLRETTGVIEPARLLGARLESGLAVESAALDAYAGTRDSAQLRRYLATATDNDHRITAIEDLSRILGSSAVERAASARRRVREWREASLAVAKEGPTGAALTAAARARQSSFDAMLQDVGGLASQLAVEGSDRRESIRRSERLSLLANASLVLVALAAVFAVGALSRRERRLTALLRRRVDEEAALRNEAREGRQELERVMKSRTRLMRGFSHDLKNPLGAADGSAELLSTGVYGALSSAQRESVERIRRSIQGALALIDDLDELARAETGRLELSPRQVDLGHLVYACGEDYRAAAEAHGLTLDVELELGPLMVETDPARVRRIVDNLLSNAIKYTLHGSVALRARLRRSAPGSADACGAVIEVSDTGPGIPASKHDLVFEEFVRLGGSGKPGTGLGLAISQRLAQALGGRITVESDVGRGSTFTLWLPSSLRAEGTLSLGVEAPAEVPGIPRSTASCVAADTDCGRRTQVEAREG